MIRPRRGCHGHQLRQSAGAELLCTIDTLGMRGRAVCQDVVPHLVLRRERLSLGRKVVDQAVRTREQEAGAQFRKPENRIPGAVAKSLPPRTEYLDEPERAKAFGYRPWDPFSW